MSSSRLISISSVAKVWELNSTTQTSPHSNISSTQLTSLNPPLYSSHLLDGGWSFDCKYFATCGTDNAISIFDIKTSKVVEVVPGPKPTGFGATSPQIRTLGFGPRRESRYLYFGGTSRQIHGHKDTIHSLCISVDEHSLVSGGGNGEVMLYSLKTNTPTHLTSPLTQTNTINQTNRKVIMEFTSDSPLSSLSLNDDFLMAAGTLNGKIQVYDIRAKGLLHTFGVGDPTAVQSLAFEPPQWAKEACVRDAGSSKVNESSKASTQALNSQNAKRAEPVAATSTSPMVAALKERIAAVKEKEKQNLMDMFSPVKGVEKITLNDPRMKDFSVNVPTSLMPKPSVQASQSLNDPFAHSQRHLTAPPTSSLATQSISAQDLQSPATTRTGGSPPSTATSAFATPSSPTARLAGMDAKGKMLDFGKVETGTGAGANVAASSSNIARLQEAVRQLREGKVSPAVGPGGGSGVPGSVVGNVSRADSGVFGGGVGQGQGMVGKVPSPVAGSPLLQQRKRDGLSPEMARKDGSSPNRTTHQQQQQPQPQANPMAAWEEYKASTKFGQTLEPAEIGGGGTTKKVVEKSPSSQQLLPSGNFATATTAAGMKASPSSGSMKQETLHASPPSPTSHPYRPVHQSPASSYASQAPFAATHTAVQHGGLVGKTGAAVEDSPRMQGKGMAAVPGGMHQGQEGMGFQQKILEAALEECLDEFKMEVKGWIGNMHLEVLRQFEVQR
ncbi:hypothetical protein HDU97_006582, partial [Phlyctochytrium planicorne]